MKKGEARALLDAIGLDVIVTWLEAGDSLRQIAGRVGCDVATVTRWAADDAQRSACIREARVAGAEWWEEQALAVLDAAYVDVQRRPMVSGALASLAREKAQACWRSAAVRDPDRYNPGRGAVAVQVNVNGTDVPARKLSTAQLQAIASRSEVLTDLTGTGVYEPDPHPTPRA